MKRFLVVENSDRMRDALRHALAEFGEVVTAESVSQAHEAIQTQGPFDLIFSDYHMRGGNGLDMIDLSQKICPETPIVLITAYGTKELTIECLNRQIFAFLEKPIFYEQFRAVIDKFVAYDSAREHEEKVKKLGILSNLIFHEIGASLQNLISETVSAQGATRNIDLPDEILQRFEDLHRTINRTADVFGNLKALIVSERLDQSTLERFDLKRVVETVAERFERSMKMSPISFRAVIPPREAWIFGARSLVENAIMNVLVNASEGILDGGGKSIELSMDFDDSDSHVDLTISNDGPPIAPEHQDRIFDFSFTTKTRQGVPRGAGLYLVKKVTEAHGGGVAVFSNEATTRFTLRFSRNR